MIWGVLFKLLCVITLMGWAQASSGGEPYFKLQVLHASDLEGGVSAIADAPNFAAVVDALEQQASRLDGGIPSILLSAGDNYLPGPFFSAAADRGGLRSVLNIATRDLINAPTLNNVREGVGRVDIMIMNILGFEASALGNHEFDVGTSLLREIISVDRRGHGPKGVRWLGAQFPYLSANLDFSEDESLRGIATQEIFSSSHFQSTWSGGSLHSPKVKIAPAAIIELQWYGRVTRIGIVGVTTPLLTTISFPGATMVKGRDTSGEDMEELAKLLQPVIDDVADGADGVRSTIDDVDKIILISHLQQISREQRLITLLNGVDLVIAGGSDALLAARSDRLRQGDAARGPYPIVAMNSEGDPVLIVSTPGQYKYVGRLLVEFDEHGRLIYPDDAESKPSGGRSGIYATDEPGVVALWGDPTKAFRPGTRAERIKILTDAVGLVVERKDANVLGRTSVFLEGRRRFVRTEETNLGNLSADANLLVARRAESNQHQPLVSIRNGGGIRSGIGFVDAKNGNLLPPALNPVSNKKGGEISQLDVENALRFNNGLTVLSITARELKWILEYAVAASDPGKTPGRFPQVGGMAFSFDPKRPSIELNAAGKVVREGDRIRSLVIISDGLCDVAVRSGRLMGDPDRTIRAVTLNFMADGGDGYPFPSFGKDRHDLLQSTSPATGAATFAPDGSEQDALAEYLATHFRHAPMEEADKPMHEDRRIQNLDHTSDTVFDLNACSSLIDQAAAF